MGDSDRSRDEGFEQLLQHLQQSRGFDFGAYKRASLDRRIRKRMQAAGIDSYSGYTDYLEAHPHEFTELFNTILINVTAFFRDPQMWEYIASDVIPRILQLRQGDASIRVWSAGCSSGEEAYSLAMLLAEALGPDRFHDRVKVYATDVDEEALSQGRAAAYSDEAVDTIPKPLLNKYFEHVGHRWLFQREFRRAVIFGRHDLISDPPISHLMLVVCRNTLMYFNTEVQQRILERFRFGLSEGGFLFLGKAEMLLARSKAFIPLDLTRRVFAKASRISVLDGETPMVAGGTDPTDMIMIDRLRELSFQMDASGQIVIDRARTLIMINDRVRTLFGLTADDLGKPLADLAVSYRPVELRSIVEQAWTEHKPISAKDVEWTTATGERVYLDVQVMPLVDASLETIGATIVFRDTTPSGGSRTSCGTRTRARNHQRRAAIDQRRARNDQRGAAIDGRGARDDERGAAVDERGARDDERGAAVDERRAADDQRAASTKQRGAQSRERVHRKHPQHLPRRFDRRRRRAAGSGVEPSIRGPVGAAHRRGARQALDEPRHRPAD
jgi:two-component system CheB/CheR fusion protein